MNIISFETCAECKGKSIYANCLLTWSRFIINSGRCDNFRVRDWSSFSKQYGGTPLSKGQFTIPCPEGRSGKLVVDV